MDCLWVIGEPVGEFKNAVKRQTGILTYFDSCDWIAFLPMSDGSGSYNRYFGRAIYGQDEDPRSDGPARETCLNMSGKCKKSCSRPWAGA